MTEIMLWIEELQTFCQVVAKRVIELRRNVTVLEQEIKQLKGEKYGPTQH